MKTQLRQHFRQLREQLSDQRRQEASIDLAKQILDIVQPAPLVASFSSFGHEIDTNILNTQLAKVGKLALPRVVDNNSLEFFHVEQFSHITLSSWGIPEPDPSYYRAVTPKEIAIILVPGLAFDEGLHRLGYGRGFYDRFLVELPITTIKIGIGFRVQHSPTPLPHHDGDVSLDQLLLT